MRSIPFGVGKLLESAIARTRRIALVRGIAVTGIVWVLCVAAVMTVDSRTVIFDDRIRLAMTAGGLLVTLVAALLSVVRPLRRKVDFRRMAGLLDARHPEHEERLMSLVELAQTDAKKAGFSASLFSLVCDLAEGDAAKIDLGREFPMKRAWRVFGVFALLALALGVGSAVSPNLVGRLFVRAVAPWVDIGNLFSRDIAVRPGDIVILSGKVIRIEAFPTDPAVTNRQPLASDHYSIRISRKTRRGWTEETSEPMAGGVYETTADLNEREWRYRVTAGPAVTRYYHVRVSEMPKYDRFLATVRYPDYTGMGAVVLTNDAIGAIRAVAGTRVAFDVQVSDPGTVVDFRIGGEPLREYEMVSNRTANWSLDLVNADGFRAEKGRGQLASEVDAPPTVVIEKPTGTLRLPSHAKIPVEITATDDIAVTSAYLRVSIDGEGWEPHYGGRLDLSGDRRFVRRTADVDLSLYNLIFAKNIRFDVVVDDGCPEEFGGPHSATSMPFTVQFAENESNYEMQELRKEVSEARRDIDEARRRLADAQNLAREVRNELNRSEKPSDGTERKSERLAHELDEAEKRIEELRNEFMADERFEPLTRPMDRLLDEVLKPALEEVEKSQFREKEERAEKVDRTVPEMAKAVQELDELAKRLSERAEKVDQFEKAKDLAARQEALAKAAREILKERPADTAKLEAWKRLEESAMRKTEELSRQKPDPEFAEARRKMETASREMAKLKAQLDEAASKVEEAKREAERKSRQIKEREQREAQELKNAAAQQQQAAQALERKDPNAAQNAQRNAEAALERANALPAVKEMQRQATAAAKTAAANAAQRDAHEALKRERDLREAIAKGEKSPDDLGKLDEDLRARLREKAKERASAAAPSAKPGDEKARAAEKAAREKAFAEQTRAADALQTAAVRRADELAKRRAGDKTGAEAKAKEAVASQRAAAEAQRAADEQLRKGAATEGVKAMQKLAAEAAADAQKSPRSAVKADESVSAQREAAAALKEEQAIRADIEKGERTAADLEAFDRALREAAAAKAAERAAVRQAEAERTRKAKAAAEAQVRELAAAVNDQKRAAEALKNAVARRAEEAGLRAAKNVAAADQKAREAANFERQAAEAQRDSEDRMERGEATEGVKALQRQASRAARAAREAPQTAEKASAAAAAQKAAADALREELAVREAIRKDELTEEDLAALDRRLMEGLLRQAAERTMSAGEQAKAALKAAKEAIGSDDAQTIGRLSDEALQTRRDEIGAALDESRLRGAAGRTEALRESENALEALKATDAEAAAREKKILSLQQSAVEALERNDRNRAMNLQKDIARAQARAAEAVADADDAKEARREATDAQDAAREATDAARRSWNNDTKARAIAAQKEAMESERKAQLEAKSLRAMDKIAAAERGSDGGEERPTTSEDGREPSGEDDPGADSETSPMSKAPAEAATDAADAMDREVKAQAAALGMSAKRSGEKSGSGKKGEKDEDESASDGGGVSDEVRDLAAALKRNDSPDFFKSLFTHLGWFKIRGAAKDGLRDGDLKDVPREYRDLVRRYFLKLSEDGERP